MHFPLLPLTLTLTFLSPILASPHSNPHNSAQHARLAKRQTFSTNVIARNVTQLEERGIEKRAYPNSRGTFYSIGLGACGQYNSEPDYIVALNSGQYGGGYPGPECFKYITITGGGRKGTAVARIMDECPGCPYGGLDMSEALFQVFDSLDTGVTTVTWWYNDDSSSTPTTTSEAPAWTPSTTSTQAAWTPSTTSTTPAWTPASSSTSSTPAWSSTSAAYSSSSTYTSTGSSTIVSSSSAVSSSAVGNSTVASSTTAWISTKTAAANSTTTTNDGSDSGSSQVQSLSNLEMLGKVTAQIGGLVVQAAQLA